ncbi:hypothetical protein MAA_08297 [Metarhizium robertsii ARSEF 23]|uniref:Peptidase S1 domain-containing protein n=1 Tax=Metarhizium robertsii (strain ARSEF 23 / ATCC MYA-3075) TaxID=655844 RepID=E9F7P8_METRA|nr:uncharacterized protein MAA_08297 [Metarhizium robertsii ARSEF 23]EFY96186.1 hypothetical protein MAA_08297 [Metarhizium robertsii ARSEF 23]
MALRAVLILLPLPTTIAVPILGGEPTEANELPSTVAIRREGGCEKDVCGGALISPDTIVTAAHCSESKETKEQVHAGSLIMTVWKLSTLIPENNLTIRYAELTSEHDYPYIFLPEIIIGGWYSTSNLWQPKWDCRKRQALVVVTASRHHTGHGHHTAKFGFRFASYSMAYRMACHSSAPIEYPVVVANAGSIFEHRSLGYLPDLAIRPLAAMVSAGYERHRRDGSAQKFEHVKRRAGKCVKTVLLRDVVLSKSRIEHGPGHNFGIIMARKIPKRVKNKSLIGELRREL